jgi:hypothetical protein
MLLILVLALLFCPSLAEEGVRGIKQKNMLVAFEYYIEKYIYIRKNVKKSKIHSTSTKDPHPSSIALGPLSRS